MVNLENIAIRDQGEFIVEKIVDALTDPHVSKTQWSFKVRWAGYDKTPDDWLDWDDLKNVEASHDYLRKNNLAKHIPKANQKLEEKPTKRKRSGDNSKP